MPAIWLTSHTVFPAINIDAIPQFAGRNQSTIYLVKTDPGIAARGANHHTPLPRRRDGDFGPPCPIAEHVEVVVFF